MKLPKEPPIGLLMSMAIRYDHGLGMPGFYDNLPFTETEEGNHEKILRATLITMRQLYEEVSGVRILFTRKGRILFQYGTKQNRR